MGLPSPWEHSSSFFPRTMVSAKRINQVWVHYSSNPVQVQLTDVKLQGQVEFKMWPSLYAANSEQLLSFKAKLVKQWPLLGQQVLVNQLWSIWFPFLRRVSRRNSGGRCQCSRPWLLCDRSCWSRLPLLGRLGLVRQPLSIFWWSSMRLIRKYSHWWCGYQGLWRVQKCMMPFQWSCRIPGSLKELFERQSHL